VFALASTAGIAGEERSSLPLVHFHPVEPVIGQRAEYVGPFDPAEVMPGEIEGGCSPSAAFGSSGALSLETFYGAQHPEQRLDMADPRQAKLRLAAILLRSG
jgi:hypothetical protein